MLLLRMRILLFNKLTNLGAFFFIYFKWLNRGNLFFTSSFRIFTFNLWQIRTILRIIVLSGFGSCGIDWCGVGGHLLGANFFAITNSYRELIDLAHFEGLL